MNDFFGKSVISVRDLDKQKLESIFDATNKIIDMDGDQRREIARGKTLGYLFFEPSTRTRLSFEAAMALLGGTSIGIADGLSSSIHKGETLGDTIKIISSYCDVLALRHSLDGSSRFAAEVSNKPVINAGSGTEEHPTQTIQDLFTIRKEKKKIDAKPQIMIPQVGSIEELNHIKAIYDNVKLEMEKKYKIKFKINFGTMLEVVRACLTSGELTNTAEFFSFGTNDLTQAVFSFSREDAESKFLEEYKKKEILETSPFQSIDENGVGNLMDIAVSRGRKIKRDLEIGICGEHGGDPDSIRFCHSAYISYVSASPFRIPVAIVAAAQAAINQKSR